MKADDGCLCVFGVIMENDVGAWRVTMALIDRCEYGDFLCFLVRLCCPIRGLKRCPCVHVSVWPSRPIVFEPPPPTDKRLSRSRRRSDDDDQRASKRPRKLIDRLSIRRLDSLITHPSAAPSAWHMLRPSSVF